MTNALYAILPIKPLLPRKLGILIVFSQVNVAFYNSKKITIGAKPFKKLMVGCF